MKTKRVNRYYCDFCKKSGCSKYHMMKHEHRCTLNPNRKCGMCDIAGEVQAPMADTLALLPSFEWIDLDNGGSIRFEGGEGALKKAVEDLHELTTGCPACMMAALRQKGIPVPLGMNYQEIYQAFWMAANAWQDRNEGIY